MNILAVAAPIAAINPPLAIVVAGSVLGISALLANGLKKKPDTVENPSESAPKIIKKTIKKAELVNKRVDKAQHTEEKQRKRIHTETKKVKQSTREIALSTQILKNATSSIEAQTEMTHEQLRGMERLQQDLVFTERTLAETKHRLQEREREMATLMHRLSDTTIKLDEAVRKNTSTSSAIIQKALSTQKAHQETIDPVLKSKDAEIKKLTDEVLSLRRTLRQINQRLLEASGTDSPHLSSVVRIPSVGSALSAPKKSEAAAATISLGALR